MSYEIEAQSAWMEQGSIRVRTGEMIGPKGEKSSHVLVNLQCSELDLTQSTSTLGAGDEQFKVKKLLARDADGNTVELNIFFDA